MGKSKEERIAAIKKLIKSNLNEKEDKNNSFDILYGNHSVQRNLPIFLFECFKIFLELSLPELELDKEEMGYVWQLIKKIENLKFEEKYPYEFFTEDGFIKLLVSYRLFFIKIARSYFKESELYKTMTVKQKEEFEEIFKEMSGKIITPKGYDYSSLVEYYIKCMKRKQGLPSERDLAKSGDYNRYKWSKLLKKPDFIVELWPKLHNMKRNGDFDKTNWFDNVYEFWSNKFATALKYDNSKKIITKEYNENIRDDNE